MRLDEKNVFNWRAPDAKESLKRVIEASSPEQAAATICAIMAKASEKGPSWACRR